MHPILFSIGRIRVYSYGLMLAAAFLIALHLASKRGRLFNIPEAFIGNLGFVVLISGIIGARALYIMMNAGYFTHHRLEIFMIQRGGLVFYGAAIAGFLSGAIYTRIMRLPVLDAADLLMPFVALAHAIGRIGCFLNGCCYGKPTSSFLGITFPFSDVKVYPTQIFSFAGLLLIFSLLFYLQKKRRFRGEILLLYFMIYGTFRFFMDFLRGDLYPVFLGLTVTQLISIAVLAVTVPLYLIKRRSAR